jgi:glycerophosphoryl diester phosphodiesterase
MLVLAHRGYHADAPPNTHAAFEQAVNIGLDGIETDVRVSADGALILFHDRCAPDGRLVSRLSHKELEAIVEYSVPTLESAIAEWGDILWNLELKTATAVERTSKLIARYRSKRRFLVTSFLHPVVLDLVQRTDVEGGLLVANRPLNLDSVAAWTSPDPRLRTIVWDYDACEGDFLSAIAAEGFRNFVYGALTRKEHQNCPRQLQKFLTWTKRFRQHQTRCRRSTGC